MSPQSSKTETPPLPAPVLAVCGASGSGKTSLLEQAMPALVKSGLHVAVVKHCGHEADLDRPGKDSDRLFRAGADVALECPGMAALRRHPSPPDELLTLVARLGADHDLVLVEGHKATPLPKLWLAGADDDRVPPEAQNVCAVLPWKGPRSAVLEDCVQRQLRAALAARPLHAGILVGGASVRMGRPKAFLPCEGATLLDRTANRVRAQVRSVFLIGDGPIPDLDEPLDRIPDAPDSSGPLAGALAALRWAPSAAWLFLPCDLPWVHAGALSWLRSNRAPGRWAVLPKLSPGGVEPLLAVYEPQVRSLLEGFVARGITSLQELTRYREVYMPLVPPELRTCWTDVDTPEQLDELDRGSDLALPPRRASNDR